MHFRHNNLNYLGRFIKVMRPILFKGQNC